MPAPRNSTAQGDVIVDDPTAYLNEVARRCKDLAVLLNLLDFADDPSPLCFHHYALRNSPDQCCVSIVRTMLEHM